MLGFCCVCLIGVFDWVCYLILVFFAGCVCFCYWFVGFFFLFLVFGCFGWVFLGGFCLSYFGWLFFLVAVVFVALRLVVIRGF